MGSGFIDITLSIIRLVASEFFSFLPWVIGGVILGEILKLASWTKMFYKYTNKSILLSNVIAAILGIASPICTIGTVPVCIQLYKSGVKLSPLISFLTASTLLNPQMIFYTWGFLGPDMAVFRIITVFIVSVVMGLIANLLPSRKIVNNKISIDTELGKEIENKATTKKITIKDFLLKCWRSLEYIAFYMIIGIFIGVIINTLVSNSLMQTLFAKEKWYSVIFSALLGIPIYQCGGISIPIIQSMMNEGMGYGQALTFFLVGPVTNLTPIMSIASMVKPKYVAIYLFLIFLLSILIGYTFDPITSLVNGFF